MKRFKAIQDFSFRGRDVSVGDLVALPDEEAKDLLESGTVEELPEEHPAPPLVPPPDVMPS